MKSCVIRPMIATVISSGITAGAYRKKSLDFSGALAGFLVMVIHFSSGYRYGSMLLVFFFTSSMLTKVGQEKKRRFDVDFKEGGQRNWVQVLSNSAIATILVIAIWRSGGSTETCLNSEESPVATCLIGGVIGHYCCCNGDTWSSEIGVLSDARPRLITTLKPVQKGVNGGVTKLGLLAAAGGGAAVGLTFVIIGIFTTACSKRDLLVIPLSILAGLLGSIVDSLLGATLQYSGFCTVRKKVVGKAGPTVKRISGYPVLDNNHVNLCAILLTTILTSTACGYIF